MLRQWLPAGLLVSIMVAAQFPDPPIDEPRASSPVLKKAVLAGGCFWCTEAVFELVEGVVDVRAGYAGGAPETARYELVSTGRTGHAEAVEITYDAARVTYGQLLRVFFEVAHDPTQLDRQGPDVGPQYRSAIFYANDEQKRIAEAYIQLLEQARVFPGRIVTRVEPLRGFYPAETYHQDFARKNPDHAYIVLHAWPKVDKLKRACPRLVRDRVSEP